MSTELVTPKQRMTKIQDMLMSRRDQLAMALPRHVSVDRMLRVALTSIARTPKLMECTPESLLGALFQSAQLGLEPDGVLGHAYLIPFNNRRKGVVEVQFLPGYKGMMDLARRSGQVSTMHAHVVRRGDSFEYAFGLEPTLRHVPQQDSADGDVTHVYAVCRLKDGGVQFEVMTAAEVQKIRKSSKAANDGPWVTHWEEMAKKTCIRRLFKMLPVSVEMSRAIALDEHAEAGVPQDLASLLPHSEELPALEFDPGPAVVDEQPAGEPGDIEERDRLVKLAEDLGCPVKDAQSLDVADMALTKPDPEAYVRGLPWRPIRGERANQGHLLGE